MEKGRMIEVKLILAGVIRGVQSLTSNKISCPFPDCPGYLEQVDLRSAHIETPQVICSVNGNFHTWLAKSPKIALKSWKSQRKLPIQKLQLRANEDRIARGQVLTREQWEARQPHGNHTPEKPKSRLRRLFSYGK